MAWHGMSMSEYLLFSICMWFSIEFELSCVNNEVLRRIHVCKHTHTHMLNDHKKPILSGGNQYLFYYTPTQTYTFADIFYIRTHCTVSR